MLGDVGDYNISTFFWYFPAQNNPSTAPLAIYLAGGPGESSIYTATASESGPCYVNVDGNSTTINPWSLNNHVNVLYIDQPVQAGFSYDSLVNGTFDLETGAVAPVQASENIPASNATFGFGTFASQNPLTTTNTTVTSVKALWHFAENWLTQFPEYQTENKKISVWGNSYGGYWAPAATAYFDKNFKDAPKESPLQHFKMDTMGITNGCIDLLYMLPFYPELAYNNTYQVEFIPEAVYQEATQNFTKPGGCRDLIEQCRELGEQGDPDWIGANQTVNEACILATDYCTFYVMGAFNALNNVCPGRDLLLYVLTCHASGVLLTWPYNMSMAKTLVPITSRSSDSSIKSGFKKRWESHSTSPMTPTSSRRNSRWIRLIRPKAPAIRSAKTSRTSNTSCKTGSRPP